MKKAFVLILISVILLILAACGESVKNSPQQNDPSEPSSTPQIEIVPDVLSEQDNSSFKTEPDKNKEAESVAILNESIAPQPDYIS